jgi:predicted  nucleic acid-binding Zn-ribbon protein
MDEDRLRGGTRIWAVTERGDTGRLEQRRLMLAAHGKLNARDREIARLRRDELTHRRDLDRLHAERDMLERERDDAIVQLRASERKLQTATERLEAIRAMPVWRAAARVRALAEGAQRLGRRS